MKAKLHPMEEEEQGKEGAAAQSEVAFQGRRDGFLPTTLNLAHTHTFKDQRHTHTHALTSPPVLLLFAFW